MIKGYTTGVFDLFHIGHLNILKRAREMCDYLIVGVSTDELVKSYKGNLPIIPFEERMAIIESIRYVDEVIPQTTLNKCEALNFIEFNVMFHGDDWKSSSLYLETEMELNKRGVNVVYFPYTKGTSSTLISEIIRKTLKE